MASSKVNNYASSFERSMCLRSEVEVCLIFRQMFQRLTEKHENSTCPIAISDVRCWLSRTFCGWYQEPFQVCFSGQKLKQISIMLAYLEMFHKILVVDSQLQQIQSLLQDTNTRSISPSSLVVYTTWADCLMLR